MTTWICAVWLLKSWILLIIDCFNWVRWLGPLLLSCLWLFLRIQVRTPNCPLFLSCMIPFKSYAVAWLSSFRHRLCKSARNSLPCFLSCQVYLKPEYHLWVIRESSQVGPFLSSSSVSSLYSLGRTGFSLLFSKSHERTRIRIQSS